MECHQRQPRAVRMKDDSHRQTRAAGIHQGIDPQVLRVFQLALDMATANSAAPQQPREPQAQPSSPTPKRSQEQLRRPNQRSEGDGALVCKDIFQEQKHWPWARTLRYARDALGLKSPFR